MTQHIRKVIRTAENIADDLDARLAATPPRPEPEDIGAEEWARGFRDAILFMLCAFLITYGVLSIGGM